MKVPYESMAIEADRLVILAVVAPEPRNYLDQYHDFLMACGWTDREFDKETLCRIDATWIRIHRRNCSPITIWN